MATAIGAAYGLVTLLYLGLGVFGSLSVRHGTWAHLEGCDRGGSETSALGLVTSGHVPDERRRDFSCGADPLVLCGADPLLLCGADSLVCGADQPFTCGGGCDAAAPELVLAHACLALVALVSAALSHHPAREALWALARRGRPGASQTPRGFSGGDLDCAPMPRRFYWAETIGFAALAPALALAAEELPEMRATVRLVRLIAGVVLIFFLPAACLRASAAAGAQPHLRALARALAAVGALCLGLCGYAFVDRASGWVGSR